jgi:hypothetical protein
MSFADRLDLVIACLALYSGATVISIRRLA